MMKVLTGKYELIERKEIDKRLKELCYKMIKLVMIYTHTHIHNVYTYM
jgi:hypothetical protein